MWSYIAGSLKGHLTKKIVLWDHIKWCDVGAPGYRFDYNMYNIWDNQTHEFCCFIHHVHHTCTWGAAVSVKDLYIIQVHVV